MRHFINFFHFIFNYHWDQQNALQQICSSLTLPVMNLVPYTFEDVQIFLRIISICIWEYRILFHPFMQHSLCFFLDINVFSFQHVLQPFPSVFLCCQPKHLCCSNNCILYSKRLSFIIQLQFLNNNHAIPPQTSRSADQGNYYQSPSPQNEQQYTYNPIGGMYHASPSHAGMSSPQNMTPTSPKKSPTANERRFTFPSHAQQMTPYQLVSYF